MSVEVYNQQIQTAWTEMDLNQKLSLKQLMKPLLICMAAAGNYNFTDIKSERRKSWKVIISSGYRAAIFAVQLLIFCKHFAAFFYLQSSSSLFNPNLLVFSWITSVIFCYLVNLKGTSHRLGHYEKVFQFWDDKIVPQFEEIGIQYNVTRIRRQSFIILTIACVNTVLGIIGSVALAVDNPYSVTMPIENSTTVVTINIAFYSFSLLGWIFPVAFAVTFSIVLREAFDSFKTSLTKACEQHECKMDSNFHKMRLLHLDLSKLVSYLDQDISWYCGSTFVFNIGLSVFILYQLMRTTLIITEIAVFTFWFVSFMLYLGLTAIFAAFVNESAHSPLDNIYYLNVEDISIHKLAQLNMFLSKLTGTQIGFSTCGLLIINKEFILTIAGVFLTYFVVLYTL